MTAFCQRCGTELSEEFNGAYFRTSDRCSDCGLAAGLPVPPLAPSDDEVGYVLGEWPVTGRVAITDALADRGMPYRWDAGLVLAIPARVAPEVDTLVDTIEDEGDGGGLSDAEVGDDDVADGGEEAQAAMADLFVAADRLQHAPENEEVAADAVVVSAIVGQSPPPFGIDGSVWREIQALAEDLVGALQAAAPEASVAASARALRDLLRDFV